MQIDEEKEKGKKGKPAVGGARLEEALAVQQIGGGPPGGFGGITFSKDGKSVLAIWLNKVEVLSSLTGKRLLSLEGHTASISAVVLHPINVSQVFTASFDGTLRMWDISDGAPVKLWNLKQPLLHLAISSDGKLAYATLLKSPDLSNPRGVSYVHRIELESGKQQRWLKAKRRADIALSADGHHLLAVARKDLFVLRGSSEPGAPPPTPAKLSHARNVVIVAVHPEGKFVVTGDERGELFLWYGALERGLSSEEVASRAVKGATAMHWHANAVTALQVSRDGAYVLSGGEEAVLVLWQVDTGHRQFLPRLGGPIRSVHTSLCGTVAACLCGTETIQLVNLLTRKVQKTIKLLPVPLPPPALSASSPHVIEQGSRGARLLGVDPRAGHVLLRTKGTEVEVWEALEGRHVGALHPDRKSVV